MPFRSQAQKIKFALLLKEGKITQEVFDEWNNATGDKKLPEHVKPKAGEPITRLARREPKKNKK